MDNYENEELHQENGYSEPQQTEAPQQTRSDSQEPVWNQSQQSYRGAGAGRRESPFADSPYVMNHNRPDQEQYRYQYRTPPVQPEEPPVKAPKEKKKKQGKAWKTVLAAVMVLVLVVGGCGITAALVNQRWESRMEQMTLEYNTRLDALQQQIAASSGTGTGNSVSGSPVAATGLTPGQVYAQNVQSVVLITCNITSTMYGQTTTGQASGSGFILSEDGYVVSNYHVVEGASSISVTMYDGTVYDATLVGSDSTNDVAVLKMDAEGLDAVTVGSSTDLIVGDQVVAIGNPLGELTSTMTVGYVSAKDRDVTTDNKTINMIQTDAAINSGNSGGPMFNMNGEVIGITTAKYSGSSSSGATIEGIGFAIPIDDVIGMLDDLVNFGYITGAYLGVMVTDMDAEDASYYGLPMGARVEEVTPGYCAEKAGLQAKDIIVALGGYEVSSVSDLTRALRNFEAGDTTTITVYRSGLEKVLEITLDEKPQDLSAATEETVQPETSQMPQDGSYDEWFRYFSPFFGG